MRCAGRGRSPDAVRATSCACYDGDAERSKRVRVCAPWSGLSEIMDLKVMNTKALGGHSLWSIHRIARAGAISGPVVPDAATGRRTMSHLRALGSGTRR